MKRVTEKMSRVNSGEMMLVLLLPRVGFAVVAGMFGEPAHTRTYTNIFKVSLNILYILHPKDCMQSSGCDCSLSFICTMAVHTFFIFWYLLTEKFTIEGFIVPRSSLQSLSIKWNGLRSNIACHIKAINVIFVDVPILSY